MEFLYTRHQTPRGARPDAEKGDKLYIIKLVSQLRLTYQIRLLAFQAKTRRKQLIIQLPKGARIDESLDEFVRDNSGLVKIERT